MNNLLYFIKDNKTCLWWDGSYRGNWCVHPRMFKTAAALLSSLHNTMSNSWKVSYAIDNPPPPERDERGSWSTEFRTWCRTQHHAWKDYIKKNKMSSIDVVKLLAKDRDWSFYSISADKTIQAAKEVA